LRPIALGGRGFFTMACRVYRIGFLALGWVVRLGQVKDCDP